MMLQEQELTFQVAQVEEILFQRFRTQFLNNEKEGNPFAEVAIAPDNIEGGHRVSTFYKKCCLHKRYSLKAAKSTIFISMERQIMGSGSIFVTFRRKLILLV